MNIYDPHTGQQTRFLRIDPSGRWSPIETTLWSPWRGVARCSVITGIVIFIVNLMAIFLMFI